MSIRRLPGQLIASSIVNAKSGAASTGFIRLSHGAQIAVAQQSSIDSTHDVVGLAFDGNDDVVLGDATAARWITVRSATSGLRVQDPAGMDRFVVDFANTKVAFAWKLDVGNNKIENVATPTSPADAATKAYVDAMGVSTRSVVLATTAPLSIDGGSSANLSTNRTLAIDAATASAAGSMSAADKSKLDGITAGAAVASVGVTTPVVNTGTATAPIIGVGAATGTTAGSMSAADKSKLDGITAGAAVASVGATIPITSTGGTTPTIGISPANTDHAGSMSTAHFNLVNGATASPTDSTLVKRGTSGEAAFGWLAPATTGVATDGFLRLASAPWQTVIGVDSSTSPGSNIRVLAIGNSNSVILGDDQSSLVALDASRLEYWYPNGDVVFAIDSETSTATLGAGIINTLQIDVGTMSVSANGYSYTAYGVGPGVQATDATWTGQPAWVGDSLHGGGFKFTMGAGGGTAKHGGDFTVHLGTADSSGNTGYFKLSETTHTDFLTVRHETGGKAVVQAPQGLKFSCALDAGTNRIANLGTPTSSADAVTKAYVDSADALLVPATRTLTTTAPLRIDSGASADLSANRTLTISAATTSAAGSMSSADKSKLDGITAGAAVASVGVTAPVVNTGTSTAPIVGISAATSTSAGSMSGADKSKLDGITAGAAVASVSVTAPVVNTGTSTAPIVGISAATGSSAGSMSGADKSKLDGITAGAAVASVSVTAPVVNTGTSTAPIIGVSAATGSTAGSMSAADKSKLDGITAGAAVASVSGATPITSTGGTTPTIGISAASADHAGSMSTTHYLLVAGATAAATANALVKRGASAEVAVGALTCTTIAASGMVTCSSGAYVSGGAGFACASMECEGGALFDSTAQFDGLLITTAGATLSTPLTWAGDIAETRVVSAQPLVSGGSGWSYASGNWTNSTLGVSLDIPIDPPHGCILRSVSVTYKGGSTHSALPTTMPAISVHYWDLSSSADVLVTNSSKSDASTTTSAFQAVHTILANNSGSGSGINHTFDRTTRRYRVVVTAESGTNGLTGAIYYGCTLNWTRPAGSNIGQD